MRVPARFERIASHFADIAPLFLLAILVVHSGLNDARACTGEEDLEGTLTVVQGDYFIDPSDPTQGMRAEREYFVEVDGKGKKKFKLTGKGKDKFPAGLKTGDKVKVHGKSKKNKKNEDVIELTEKPSTDNGSSLELIESGPEAAPSPRKALTFRVNFTDSSVSCSATSVANNMYYGTQSVNSIFSRSSNGMVYFPADNDGNGSADVVTVNVPYSAGVSGCPYSSIVSAARQEATSQGVNLNSFDRFVYLFGNGVSSCGWAGLGTLSGGSSSFSIVNGQYCNTVDIYAHELGHNDNLHHAAVDSDNNGSHEGEYNDRSCTMGYGGVGPRPFNAPHQFYKSWLSSSNALNVNSSGSYNLLGLDVQDNSSLKVLRIPRSNGGYYYLSYRVADSILTGLPSEYRYRLSLHHTSNNWSYLIKGLAQGESWQDPATGMTITHVTNNNNSTTASVNLSFNCVPTTPSIALSPTSFATNSPGSAVANADFLSTVSNNDASCDPATFNLVPNVPSSWSYSLTSSSVTVNASAEAQVSYRVLAPSGTVDGKYTITLGAADQSGQRPTATGSVFYLVDRVAPSTINNLSASGARKNKVNLSWSVPSDGSGSGVLNYQIYRNNALVTSTSSTSYQDTPGSGTHSYTVRSTDKAGNISANSNIAEITLGGGGGGGKGGSGGGGPGKGKGGQA